MVELLDTAGTEGVTTVNKNTRNTLANVVLETAKLADVKTTRLVVKIEYIHFGMNI